MFPTCCERSRRRGTNGEKQRTGLAFSSVPPLARLFLAGCATAMRVSSYVERDRDFAQYRTYEWGSPDALPTGDPRLDENPLFLDRLEGAVERGLAAKGIERSAEDAANAADLLIHYHANITQRIDVNRIDREYGYCYGEGCQPRVIELEAGTLVLDVVDALTNRVIWRGWAQDTVEEMLDDPDRLAAKIDEAVSRMLERLPEGGAPTVSRNPSVQTGDR